MAYEFTQDSFRQFSEEVISAGGDQATLTTLLSQMQDVIIDNIGKMEQLTQNNENVTKENERLKSANMDLFLRIGSQAPISKSPLIRFFPSSVVYIFIILPGWRIVRFQ